MKVAVIGTGFWGKNHVREYLSLGHEVVACDVSADNLAALGKDFGVRETTQKIEDLLEDQEITAVSVCVPNQFHFETAKKCLEAGKHVLVEKPMTLSHETAEELVRIAGEKKLVLTVGHIFRFNNAVKEIKRMIQAKEFGTVYLCKLAWTNRERLFLDRDILFDLSPHAFDILHYVFGKNPQTVYAIGKAFRREGGEEAAFVNAVLDAVLVNLEVSWVTPEKKRSFIVVGEKKSAFVDLVQQKIDVHDVATNTWSSPGIPASNPLREELESFLSSVQNGSASPVSAQAGADVVNIIELAVRSLREKRILSITE